MDANAAEVEVIQKNDENSPPPAITAVCTYNSNCCLQYFYLNFTEIGKNRIFLAGLFIPKRIPHNKVEPS